MFKGRVALLIFFFLSLIPNELYVEISGVRLEAYRIFLILYFVASFRRIVAARYEPFEKWLMLFTLWSMLSFIENYGISGIQSGLIRFLEVFVVYFIGRDVCLNGGRTSLRWSLHVISICYLLMVPLALVESQNGMRLTHTLAADLAGTYAQPFIGDKYFRLGVYRSSVVFSHPILYSITAMTLIVLTWYLFKGFYRYLFMVGYVVAGYTSMTSAGFAILAIQLALLAIDYAAKYWPVIRRMVLINGLFLLAFIQLFSNQGAVRFLMNFVSLNAQTANARYLQWHYAWDDVVRNKFFGIGFEQWSRPWWMHESVDSYWLSMGLTHGLVGLILVATFWVALTRFIFNSYTVTNDKLIYVFFCAICGIIFAGMTVAFFDRAQTFMYLFVGMMVGYTKIVKSDYISSHKLVNKSKGVL